MRNGCETKNPSEYLSEFLAYIDRIRYEHKAAQDAINGMMGE